VELARIANDGLAELVTKYPDRFIGAAACLPMNDIDAALIEADRAIQQLGCCGVEIFTDICGKPLDRPEFFPLYQKMQDYDLPILLHPRRTNTTADYADEERSKFLIYTNFGWPFETAKAMARLAFGGVLERFPKLKIVTHHAGGLVPFFSKRIELSWEFNRQLMGYQDDGQSLSKPPIDYYKQFYCDTAVQGNTPALMCALDFFGADHMMFATDSPYDNELGVRVYRETIPAVEAMAISNADKDKIYEGNARRLFRLQQR
jgi:aminocarboxymuconate-semialdehyde decarboxylase